MCRECSTTYIRPYRCFEASTGRSQPISFCSSSRACGVQQCIANQSFKSPSSTCCRSRRFTRWLALLRPLLPVTIQPDSPPAVIRQHERVMRTMAKKALERILSGKLSKKISSCCCCPRPGCAKMVCTRRESSSTRCSPSTCWAWSRTWRHTRTSGSVISTHNDDNMATANVAVEHNTMVGLKLILLTHYYTRI